VDAYPGGRSSLSKRDVCLGRIFISGVSLRAGLCVHTPTGIRREGGTQSLFICVADHKMLGHQLNSKIIGGFPSDYIITNDIIEHQLKQKTNHFDHRFLKVFKKMNSEIRSKLIYNCPLNAKHINNPTHLLIWDVEIASA